MCTDYGSLTSLHRVHEVPSKTWADSQPGLLGALKGHSPIRPSCIPHALLEVRPQDRDGIQVRRIGRPTQDAPISKRWLSSTAQAS